MAAGADVLATNLPIILTGLRAQAPKVIHTNDIGHAKLAALYEMKLRVVLLVAKRSGLGQ